VIFCSKTPVFDEARTWRCGLCGGFYYHAHKQQHLTKNAIEATQKVPPIQLVDHDVFSRFIFRETRTRSAAAFVTDAAPTGENRKQNLFAANARNMNERAVQTCYRDAHAGRSDERSTRYIILVMLLHLGRIAYRRRRSVLSWQTHRYLQLSAAA